MVKKWWFPIAAYVVLCPTCTKKSWMISYKGVTKDVVKCAECRTFLPQEEEAIKRHMMNEHIMPKQKAVNDIVSDVKEKIQLIKR